MFSIETTALLRTVLNEVCQNISQYEIGARTQVASKILEAASRGETSVEGLKQIGRKALSEAEAHRLSAVTDPRSFLR